MNYTSKKMTIENAKLISKWQYEHPYDTYNFDEGQEAIDELLNENYYCVYLDDELVGYYCVGKAAQVPTEISKLTYNNDKFVDAGLGMKPDVTGKGKGKEFVGYVLRCVKDNSPDKGIRLTVAAFNSRAIKVYEHLGFVYLSEFIKESSGLKFNIMILDL